MLAATSETGVLRWRARGLGGCVGDGPAPAEVIGPNGENRIRAEGTTCAEAWRRALDQAPAVGLLPGGLGPVRG
jgi:hypothetical protein